MVLIGGLVYLWGIFSETKRQRLVKEREEVEEVLPKAPKPEVPEEEVIPKEKVPLKPEAELPTFVLAEYQVKLDIPVIVDQYKLEIKLIESDPGQNYADIEINYSEREGYDGLRSIGEETGWYPSPVSYPELAYKNELLEEADRVYRTHRFCEGKRIDDSQYPKGHQIIELKGYKNFVCRDRYYEQCILDGTFDKYYEEHCDYGKARFFKEKIKWSSDFGIELSQILDDSVRIKVHGRTIHKKD